MKSITVSQIHSTLFSGSSDKTIRSWNLLTGESLNVFKGHTRGIEDLALDEGETFLYSASSDGLIMKWNPLTAECLQVFKDHLTSIYCLKIVEEEMWTGNFLLHIFIYLYLYYISILLYSLNNYFFFISNRFS